MADKSTPTPTPTPTSWPSADAPLECVTLDSADNEFLRPFLSDVFNHKFGFTRKNVANVKRLKAEVARLLLKHLGVTLPRGWKMNHEDWQDLDCGPGEPVGIRITIHNGDDEDYKYALDTTFVPDARDDDDDDDDDCDD